MTLHKEGYKIIIISSILVGGMITLLCSKFFGIPHWVVIGIDTVFVFLWIIIVQFFRVPRRKIAGNSTDVVCPADGKVVVIERVFEPEFLKEECIQLSIFMSPLNVHANYTPIAGKVVYTKYHEGKYLVAWHPKSSTENERSTMIIETGQKKLVLVRQIAGALARRICFYASEGQEFNKGDEFGFIKFGSRVDVFLPLTSEIKVKLGQVVKNRQDILASL